jgi:hypothetical protein
LPVCGFGESDRAANQQGAVAAIIKSTPEKEHTTMTYEQLQSQVDDLIGKIDAALELDKRKQKVTHHHVQTYDDGLGDCQGSAAAGGWSGRRDYHSRRPLLHSSSRLVSSFSRGRVQQPAGATLGDERNHVRNNGPQRARSAPCGIASLNAVGSSRRDRADALHRTG